MLVPLVVAALVLLGPYLYRKLRYKRRKQYAIFPQRPTSLILGHLRTLGYFIRTGKPNGHPDLAFAAMNETLGRPPLMFVDTRPLGSPMVIVRSHEIAEQISKASKLFPYSLPKTPRVYGHMVHVTGPTSILAAHGEDWKRLRRRFNPGFAPQHLITFLPCILEKSFAFLGHLDSFAQTGQPFSLVLLTGNLTFDIISSVVMDFDFGAQNVDNPSDFIRTYQELFQTYASEQMDLPWFFTPRIEWKRRQLAKRLKNTLRTVVRNAFTNRQTKATKYRSILSLSLQGVNSLTAQAVDEACDQLSTFLFAGHDTTSILLSWVFYELSRTPQALQAVRDELDELFGPDQNPSIVRDKLLSDGGQDLLHRMAYTAAVIKETLRLWPPAGTARIIERGAGVKVHTSTAEYVLEGVDVYNCAIMIQRDPEVYGVTANDFVPERWLHNAANLIPPSAWRPFEKGPRNCIGQELANLEARVVIALVARRYDFVKVGVGELSLDKAGQPVLNAKGQFKVASEMYPTRQVTPKPVDGMMMQVRVR
ncbi:Sterigmatocystin biosynthesis P450 monooxygenase stcS [Madurella fahalii]|uniref:Sterigmatocystin biosynthesis P450 monooxygenase stcS n=1 Tax=Madurella fahalii TaxID=1157608 RepID=A0ABQ0FWB0_9PEZI